MDMFRQFSPDSDGGPNRGDQSLVSPEGIFFSAIFSFLFFYASLNLRQCFFHSLLPYFLPYAHYTTVLYFQCIEYISF